MGACGPLGQLISIKVISVDFKDSHFEFRVINGYVNYVIQWQLLH